MRYRIAVLDSGDDQTIADVRAMRARIDSKYAAFYYPWVKVLDPVTQQEINLPPSGFVSGIYARNDVDRAVYKAPANEVVRLAIGFEKTLNKAQQEVLNPEGINCFRFFEGRGYRLWAHGRRVLIPNGNTSICADISRISNARLIAERSGRFWNRTATRSGQSPADDSGFFV